MGRPLKGKEVRKVFSVRLEPFTNRVVRSRFETLSQALDELALMIEIISPKGEVVGYVKSIKHLKLIESNLPGFKFKAVRKEA